MNTATRNAAQILAPVIATATRQAVNGTSAMLTSEAQDAVVKEVAAVVVNQTNNEPWWQSRVTWGAIIAAIAGILGIFGYTLPSELQGRILEGIIAAGPLISAAIVLYGRWVAQKPLGQ